MQYHRGRAGLGEEVLWDVFISYARADRAAAEPIKEKLCSFGLTVFFDIEGGIEAGDAFPQRIADAVAQSRIVLALWTPYALTRPWPRRECFMAREVGTLLPVALETLSPSDLKEFIDASYESLVGYEWAGKHFGWSQTLASIARRLEAWAENHASNPEATSVRERARRVQLEAEHVRPAIPVRSAIGLTTAAAIWEQIRVSTDSADLLRFAANFPGTSEAFEARRKVAGIFRESVVGKLPRQIWSEISESYDIADIQCFAETFTGTAEGLEARRRVAALEGAKHNLQELEQIVDALIARTGEGLKPDQIEAIEGVRDVLQSSERTLRHIENEWPRFLEDTQRRLNERICAHAQLIDGLVELYDRRRALWRNVSSVAAAAVAAAEPPMSPIRKKRAAPGCFGVLLWVFFMFVGGATILVTALGMARLGVVADAPLVDVGAAVFGLVIIPALLWYAFLIRPNRIWAARQRWERLRESVNELDLLSCSYHPRVWREYYAALKFCGAWAGSYESERWPDKQTVAWAESQGRLYINEKLPHERRLLLDEVGFDWRRWSEDKSDIPLFLRREMRTIAPVSSEDLQWLLRDLSESTPP